MLVRFLSSAIPVQIEQWCCALYLFGKWRGLCLQTQSGTQVPLEKLLKSDLVYCAFKTLFQLCKIFEKKKFFNARFSPHTQQSLCPGKSIIFLNAFSISTLYLLI